MVEIFQSKVTAVISWDTPLQYSFLPGKSMVGCSPWGRWELDTTHWLHFHFSLSCIGEGNGNPLQCSCLENPGTAEPGGLPSIGVTQSRTWLKQLSSSRGKGIGRSATWVECKSSRPWPSRGMYREQENGHFEWPDHTPGYSEIIKIFTEGELTWHHSERKCAKR